VVLADQPRSVSREKRYVKIAGTSSAKLVDEVREPLAVLLQTDTLTTSSYYFVGSCEK
jgi:hypothetical protein